MICQSWLIRGDVQLLAVHHRPPEQVPLGAAILLAGFSHPMCDADYFMSKLARQLAQSGLFVAQVDPRGHGDSPGEFEDVDLDTLRADIELILEHYSARFPESLLCIGRGLAAPLLAEASARKGLLGVAGVSPYCVPAHVVQDQLAAASETPGDAFDVFPGNDYVDHADFSEPALRILNALGVVPYNLHGMRISRRFLKGLAGFDAAAALGQADPARSLWLHPDAPGAGPLPRDPAFQRTVISRLTDWALDRCALG